MRASRYPGHSGRRPPSLSASLCRAPSPLSSFSGTEPLTAPPKDAAFSSLFCLFSISLFLSAFACSFEVITVTSVSLPPFVSRRGLSNTNQRLSLLNPPFSHCTQPRLCRIAVILSKTHRSLLPPPFVSNRGFWSKNHHFSLKYKPSATPSFSPPPLLFSVFFVRSACACCPEVTVTSSSLRLCRLAVFFRLPIPLFSPVAILSVVGLL